MKFVTFILSYQTLLTPYSFGHMPLREIPFKFFEALCILLFSCYVIKILDPGACTDISLSLYFSSPKLYVRGPNVRGPLICESGARSSPPEQSCSRSNITT